MNLPLSVLCRLTLHFLVSSRCTHYRLFVLLGLFNLVPLPVSHGLPQKVVVEHCVLTLLVLGSQTAKGDMVKGCGLGKGVADRKL